jgi:hypothetical protein
MKDLTIYTVTLDNGKFRDDFCDPSHLTLVYAVDKEGNMYSNLEQDVIDDFTPKDIVTRANIGDINKEQLLDFGLHFEIEGYHSVYERVQRYGGAEEGGWYYHNSILTDLKVEDVEEGRNQYGEGYEFYKEPLRGMNEYLETEHYC